MTPKEKAEEIHMSMCYAIKTEETQDGFFTNTIHAKNCSLVLVDNILNEYWSHDTNRRDWWEQVKQEIYKL